MDSFSQEALMIELGQMPPQFVLDQIKEKNILEEEERTKEEVYNLLNTFQAWSWV